MTTVTGSDKRGQTVTSLVLAGTDPWIQVVEVARARVKNLGLDNVVYNHLQGRWEERHAFLIRCEADSHHEQRRPTSGNKAAMPPPTQARDANVDVDDVLLVERKQEVIVTQHDAHELPLLEVPVADKGVTGRNACMQATNQ